MKDLISVVAVSDATFELIAGGNSLCELSYDEYIKNGEYAMANICQWLVDAKDDKQNEIYLRRARVIKAYS